MSTTTENSPRGPREFFLAALVAFADDLAGADALELLAAASDPASAARLADFLKRHAVAA